MLMKLGQKSDALNESLLVFAMIRDTCIDNVENMQDMLYLAFIFEDCQNAKMTAVAMLKYVESFNALTSFISFSQDGGFTIEKDGQEYASSLCTFEAFIVMIHDIGAKCTDDMEVAAILERLKNEIAISRSTVGF